MRTIRGNEKKGNPVSREKELQISSKTTQFLSFMDLLKTFWNGNLFLDNFFKVIGSVSNGCLII